MSCLSYLVFLSVLARAQSLQCRNAEGGAVDWFAMYRMPRVSTSKDPLVRAGLAAMYLDGSKPSWTQSAFNITDTRQALYQTLAPFYSKSRDDDTLLLMYNDEFPNGTTSLYHGHTKGVVGFDTKTGFWLVHSVPSFPSQPQQGYHWPDTEINAFGQSFLCISFPYQALEDIGQQLYFNYPHVYVRQVPAAFQAAFPQLRQAGQGHPESPPWTSTRDLLSLAGNRFTSFAKFTKFYADLYDSLVAPVLRSSLLVESWRRGRGSLPSNCSAHYQVMNVTEVSIDGGRRRVTFRSVFDHSKWAVSASQGQGDWVCVGDINRQKPQFKRAGGTVCFQNAAVWRTYSKSVGNYAHCPGQGGI